MARQKNPVARPNYADPRELRMLENVRVADADPEEQEQFEESVYANGVESPLSVRMGEDGTIEVIFGQRRLKAALKAYARRIDEEKKAAKAEKREPAPVPAPSVPIFWSDIPAEGVRAAQLRENLDRSGMNPLDIAAAMWDMYNNEAGGSQQFIADAMNRPKAWVSKMLKFGADLPDSANTVARALMMANQLTSPEMAYTLCQIEEISLEDAKRVGGEIAAYVKAEQRFAADPTEGNKAELAKLSPHTRATLRDVLKQLQTASDGTPSAIGGTDAAQAAAAAAASQPVVVPPVPKSNLTAEEIELIRFVKHVLDEAAVSPKLIGQKQKAAALLVRLIGE